MTVVELLLGWGIVTLLGIGSIVAAEPFWGSRRPDGGRVVIEIDPPRDRRSGADRSVDRDAHGRRPGARDERGHGHRNAERRAA